jgi:hypothetical protein
MIREVAERLRETQWLQDVALVAGVLAFAVLLVAVVTVLVGVPL